MKKLITLVAVLTIFGSCARFGFKYDQCNKQCSGKSAAEKNACLRSCRK